MLDENTHNYTRKKAMIAALESTLGIVTEACVKVGIERKTHYNWYELDAGYKEEVDELKNVSHDFVISKLYESIKGVELPEDKIFCFEGTPVIVPTIKRYPPDGANIRYYLDRQGKDMGFSPVQEKDNDSNKIPISEFTEAVVSTTGSGIIPPAKSGMDEQPNAT